MGRYTTVQAYADNNPSMRSVSYDQATAGGGSGASSGAVRPEKVDNPYGSTAGAGSGEFHVYRHARSREMARLKRLDEEETERLLDEEFETKIAACKTEEERKTEKRRRKRQREKESKRRKKNLRLGGVGDQQRPEGGGATGEEKGAQDDDFEYTPLHRAGEGADDDGEKLRLNPHDPDPTLKEVGDMTTTKGGAAGGAPGGEGSFRPGSDVPQTFSNDGSFLEMMKKRLAAEGCGVVVDEKKEVNGHS